MKTLEKAFNLTRFQGFSAVFIGVLKQKGGVGGCNVLFQVHLSWWSLEMRRTQTHCEEFFYFACNEPIAGGLLLSPAVSFSVLIVSLSNTPHPPPAARGARSLLCSLVRPDAGSNL